MTQNLEYFFDFRSPYSYLAYNQLPSLGLQVILRPMNVLSVMEIVGNTPTSITCKAKGDYVNADLGRWAKKYGIQLNNADMRALDANALLRAVLAAPAPEIAAATADALFAACWGTGTTLSSSSEIVDYLTAQGVDTNGLAERIDDQATVDALAANNKEAGERGVFGAPTILIGDAMFFGNDRMEFVREHVASTMAA